jgi:hypothetical protein
MLNTFLSYAICAEFLTQLILAEKWTLKNSVALVHERTILTERPPLVGEVSADFDG